MGSSTKLAGAGQRTTVSLSLLTAILVPLYFNTWADRSFEHQKNLLLMTLSMFICVALTARVLGSGTERAALLSLRHLAGFRALMLVLAAYAAASAASIAPLLSWAGSYDRMQGTLTVFAAALAGIGLASLPRHLLTLQQFSAIATVTSVPVACYAIIQHIGLDPLTWADNVTLRSTSHLGNPVHLGAWLILVIPLTGALLAVLRNDRANTGKAPALRPHWLLLVATGIALLLQLLALFWTYSRGPYLGLLAAAAVVVLAWLMQQRERGNLLRALLAIGVCAVIGGAVLATQLGGVIEQSRPPAGNAPVSEGMNDAGSTVWSDLPDYAKTLDPSSQARLLIWQSAASALYGSSGLRSGIPAVEDETSPSTLRLLFGFGPETNGLVLNQSRSVDWARVENPALGTDRAHNMAWDNLLTIGMVGALAVHLLYLALFSFLLQALGVNASRRQQQTLAVSWWLGGGVCAAIAVFANHLALAPPLFVAGSLAGATLSVVLRRQTNNSVNRAGRSNAAYSLALLAALVAHLVEGQFGVGGAANQLYFFLLLGLVLGSAAGSGAAEPATEPATKTATRTPPKTLLWPLIVPAVVVLMLCYLPPGLLKGLGATGEGLTLAGYAVVLLTAFVAGTAGYRSGTSGETARSVFGAHGGIAALLILTGVAVWNYPLAHARANTLFHAQAGAAGQHFSAPAIQALQKAVTLAPAQPVYLTAQAQARLEQLSREQPINRADATDAVFRPLQTAIEQQPWSATFVANKARAHTVIANRTTDMNERTRHLHSAMQLQRRAVAMHPHDARLLNALVALEFQLQPDCDRALAGLVHSRSLDAHLAHTNRLIRNVAKTCLAQSPARFGRAWVEALANEPADSWLDAAQSLQDQQQHALALQCLNVALQQTSDPAIRWQLNVRKVDSLRLNRKYPVAQQLARDLAASAPVSAPAAMLDFINRVLEQ